jgi:diadenosine tetraphosphate (Ap4A) HIT family hydrolase|tara:strand:- start:55 stop:480 length:426 start_codon:yes stop_codon:yes gene_type:complete
LKSILKKFDLKKHSIKEYKNWYLLLRKDQVTIGAMVLIEKSFQTNYSEISKESFIEFSTIVHEIENVLKKLFKYDKINYLMLMMVDNEVHYHVIPRYENDILFEGQKFTDTGWPGMPDLSFNNKIDQNIKLKLIKLIKDSL